MKTEKNILIAFILNLVFSIFEFIGGLFTRSFAILSDSIHDLGDALSIGISYFLEKKSKQKADYKYTYGYVRFSVMGSIITTLILIIGSLIVIYGAIKRIINPLPINYNGMIILAIIGVIINFTAALYTKDGNSLNQRAVNLHMLEDVLGWVVVLIGSILMKFTDISLIDAILSIGVALFILINACKNIKKIGDIFLEKTPDDISIKDLKKHLLSIKGILDVHHIHIRSIDGYNNFATLHIVVDKYDQNIKKKVKDELQEFGIIHSTVELELKDEHCECEKCNINVQSKAQHHHH